MRIFRILPLLPLLLSGLLSACDLLTPAVVIARLDVVSGDSQTVQVNSQVPRDLVIRAVDTLGAPLPRIAVAWGTESGTVTGDSLTDTQGYARAAWTLGTVSGTRSAWVSAALARGIQATFRATALPGPVAKVEQVRPAAGVELTAAEGNVLPDSLVIRVLDAFGNPTPGVPVEWRVTKGGGAIRTASSPVTDARGLAAAAWQVGIALPNAAFARVGRDTIRYRASPTLLSPRDTVRLPSSLKYLDIRIPTDTASARPGRMVGVFYSEYLLDGTLLQRVRSGAEPLRFILGSEGVIPGFNEGVSGMRRSAIRRLVVPPEIGYRDGVVRVYDVELVEIGR